VVAELIQAIDPARDYLAQDEAGRIEMLLEELATPRLLASPWLDYLDETRGAGDLPRRPRRPPALRQGRGAQLHHLQDRRRLRPAGSRRARQGGRPAAPAEGVLDVNIIPLFETIGDLQNAAGVMDRLFAMPAYMALLESRGWSRR
jgi:phosphoenolpyruvate carboxylase